MKATLLNSKRLLIEFPSLKEMNLTAFRITEFKEGPESLKGKPFNDHDFLDAYCDEEGNLKYMAYWEGHNWSMAQFKAWFNMGEMMSPREQELMSLINESGLEKEGYIILMEEGDEMTMRHELSHGLYFDNPEYKRLADTIVNSIPADGLKIYQDHLKAMNYNESVIMDESQAYLVAFDKEEFAEICPNVHPEAFKKQIDELGALYDKFNKIKK